MDKSNFQEYQGYVRQRLQALIPFLQNYARGDFLETISIPDEEDEFTPLLVGIRLMVDDFRVMLADHKRQESTLRDREERLMTIIDASKDAMVVIDPEGIITLFNPAAEKIFGCQAENILGQSVVALMPPSYRHQHGLDVTSYFQTGKPNGVIGKTIEVPAVRADGEEFVIEISLANGGRGDGAFVLGVIRDITDRKRRDDEFLAYTKEVEKTNQQLEKFNHMAIGREQRMIELKREVNALAQELGREGPYDITFAGE